MRLNLLFSFTSFLFLLGCTTTRSNYTVKVDAIADTDLIAETYILKSGMKDVSENDLRFKEYSRIVANALSKKGYKQISDIKNAHMVVLFSYGISNPNSKVSTIQMPVYGSQNNTTTVVKNSWGQKIGSFETQPSNPFAPGGYQPVSVEFTTYNRFILLTAFDAKDVLKPRAKDEKFDPKMTWETKVTSTGSSGDLRKVFPIMMLGAMPYIGKNSGEQRIIDLELDPEKDPRLEELVTGISQNEKTRKPANKEK